LHGWFETLSHVSGHQSTAPERAVVTAALAIALGSLFMRSTSNMTMSCST
jgi:hypothetical protein